MYRCLLVVALFACDDGGAEEAGDAGLSPDAAGDAEVMDTGVEPEEDMGSAGHALSLLLATEDGLSPLEDGMEVPFEWGFQGGVMIRPVVVLPEDAPLGEELRVEIRNEPDPEAPGEVDEFPAFSLKAEIIEMEGHKVVGPFDNQIGWSDPTGVGFEMTVLVGDYEPLVVNLRLEAIEEQGPCAGIPGRGDSCSYRMVPGFGRVVELAGGDCNGLVVEAAFDAESVRGLECVAELSGRSFDEDNPLRTDPLDAACVMAAVGVDDRFPMSLGLIERGTCSPILLELRGGLGDCPAACE